ncbi:MAG TPA: type II toxin-antitoxin system RelE/ParE family toxin [Bryobacteraceae bacterium]|nr:type II toxin-antitoxin system RelE/ParE family toxin [Bryobacteraceae bacterium]
MIRGFRCKDTEAIFHLEGSRKFRNIEQTAYRRLVMLDGAHTLADLAAIRSNHLEALRGDRAGQYSIRVNEQWRICFVWRGHDACEVEIVDYH